MGYFHRESLIERLARESGWRVAEKEGDFFRIRADDDTPIRYISIRCRDQNDSVPMWVYFPVRFPLAAVTPELTMGLLLRNHDLFFGRWCLEVMGSCELHLYLHYSAIKSGLTPSSFNAICREMVGERDALHAELRGQLASMHRVTLGGTRTAFRQGTTGNSLATLKPGEIVWQGD